MVRSRAWRNVDVGMVPYLLPIYVNLRSIVPENEDKLLPQTLSSVE